MKRVLLLSLLIPIFCYSQDFRNSYWGDSFTAVKTVEGDDIEWQTEGNAKAFSSNVAGLDCYVVYAFTDDKLTRAVYLFTEKHANKNLYISDFKEVKGILQKKYGESKEKKEMYWYNDLYKDDYNDYGMAVSVGHLAYIGQYESQLTKIEHILSGDNYEITHKVLYISKAYERLDEKKEEEQNLSDF